MIELLKLDQILPPIQVLFERGGVILPLISLVILFMWTLILERIHFLKNYCNCLMSDYATVWKTQRQYSARANSELRSLYLSKFNRELQKNISLIQISIIICPLLGLLGTVTGMIEVFGSLATSASGNPRLLAAGVSKATLPTMAGMVAAVSGILMVTLLKNIIEKRRRILSRKLLVKIDS